MLNEKNNIKRISTHNSIPANYSDDYYIVVRQWQSVETWSTAPVCKFDMVIIFNNLQNGVGMNTPPNLVKKGKPGGNDFRK